MKNHNCQIVHLRDTCTEFALILQAEAGQLFCRPGMFACNEGGESSLAVFIA